MSDRSARVAVAEERVDCVLGDRCSYRADDTDEICRSCKYPVHSLTCSRLIGDEAYICKFCDVSSPICKPKANIFYNPIRNSTKKRQKNTTKTTINPPLANPPLEICVHCKSEVSSECKYKFCAGALHVFCSVDIDPNNFVELEDRTEFCCPKCAISKMPAQENYNQYSNDMEAENLGL